MKTVWGLFKKGVYVLICSNILVLHIDKWTLLKLACHDSTQVTFHFIFTSSELNSSCKSYTALPLSTIPSEILEIYGTVNSSPSVNPDLCFVFENFQKNQRTDKYCVHIWTQHGKCIKTSTNKPVWSSGSWDTLQYFHKWDTLPFHSILQLASRTLIKHFPSSDTQELAIPPTCLHYSLLTTYSSRNTELVIHDAVYDRGVCRRVYIQSLRSMSLAQMVMNETAVFDSNLYHIFSFLFLLQIWRFIIQ